LVEEAVLLVVVPVPGADLIVVGMVASTAMVTSVKL
jgi:hypothetical protein